jgi:hypothetical protein
VQAFVCGDVDDARLDALLSAAARGQEADLPPGRLFLLRDLRPDARERVLGQVLRRRLARWEAGARDQLEEALPLLEQYRGLGLTPPPGLGDETRALLGHALADAARKFAEGAPGSLGEIALLLRRARAAGVDVPAVRAEESFGRGVERVLSELESSWGPHLLEELRQACAVAADAAIDHWMPAAQARFFRLLKTRGNGSAEAAAAAEALSVAVPPL